MTPYILAVLCTFFLGLLVNLLRFKQKNASHRLVLIGGSALAVILIDVVYPSADIEWLVLLFIGVSVATSRLHGAVFSIVLSVSYLILRGFPVELLEVVTYPLFAVTLLYLLDYINELRRQRQRRLDLALHTSKQLNIFREVSYKIQQTMDENQVLQIILTAVTAGYGFSFNRAMVFLLSEDGKRLEGKMATGPLTPEEGFETWQLIAENKYKLNDLFRLKEIEKTIDHPLNEKVRRLSLRLDGNTIVEQAMKQRKPFICKRSNESDIVRKRLELHFQMEECAIIPFFHQQDVMGVMFIDNPVNNLPITDEWVDQVLPLTHQASIALYQSKLYNRIEELAQKDGLTGLFNQRVFQQDIERFLAGKKQAPVSLVLMDIDHFKVYNDTNGHLLGNEVLTQLADILEASVKSFGHAYRFGGEEFVLLLPDTSLVDAKDIAETIRNLIETTEFPSESSQPGKILTVSVGVSSTELDETMCAEELIEITDEALYEAKSSGKNKVVTTEEHVL
ncbi:sensor domain-containing diguanylate cyclase [Salimicrobium halophilum]|uniref:Diguanylate cyclase (GGDEF) domain-containing protein n=1 Tax=Salimicrobium halophilum TaxID=86666 RepID=A0A1G8T4E5_9BACI|nr:sensor domain-containing diguanylate cyclase [Salimicrobium halophilum]SDJ36271.1 diguanylate cyclase (GGDEF) domain-containing protein [Salimicrobium halophilum]